MKKAIISLFLTISLNASFTDGNRLVEDMREYKIWSNGKKNVDYGKVMGFMGYVSGVSDSLGGVLICYPSNVTLGQVNAIVIKYIENNPDKWNQNASFLVSNPLIKTFPCKKTK